MATKTLIAIGISITITISTLRDFSMAKIIIAITRG